jgi:hypothetical protein
MNLHKYDKIKLNPKGELNEKIKTLFLLFDRDVINNKLTYVGTVRLLNFYIKTLIQHEEFEAVVAFTERKKRKLFKYRRDRRDFTPGLVYRFLKRKLYKLLAEKFHDSFPIRKLFRSKAN